MEHSSGPTEDTSVVNENVDSAERLDGNVDNLLSIRDGSDGSDGLSTS